MKNTTNLPKEKAYYHLPGLFEFYELYRLFLPLWEVHREYFYDWCEIGSIYGAPADCLWGGGRIEAGFTAPEDVCSLLGKYDISARLTFSNSLITKEHLSDRNCNRLCEIFAGGKKVRNGIIIYSDILLDYIKSNYPEFYFVDSTTKVITDYDAFKAQLDKEDYTYVVPDFRLNKAYDLFDSLPKDKKDKVELLCNECCTPKCRSRKMCYEAVSYKNLGIDGPSFKCTSPDAEEGYKFSKAMANPMFIGTEDIINKYLPMGITNFKIEGRSLGSALIFEFILYYMTKPEYEINVREAIYLDNMLDLF